MKNRETTQYELEMASGWKKEKQNKGQGRSGTVFVLYF
jgi:hypothetical protein